MGETKALDLHRAVTVRQVDSAFAEEPEGVLVLS